MNNPDCRKQILQVQNDPNLTNVDKNKRIQQIIREYNTSKPPDQLKSNDNNLDNKGNDLDNKGNISKKTHNDCEGDSGCQHYMIKCKIVAPCCNEIYWCRLCHNEHENHEIDRYKINEIICAKCNHNQEKSNQCTNCGIKFATYYCDKCNVWQSNNSDDVAEINIYHCDECKLCRKGNKDSFYHCNTCGGCQQISNISHKCFTNSFKSDCSICGEDMFNSHRTSKFLPCGHALHNDCLEEYKKHKFNCPICKKSMFNLNEYWKELEQLYLSNPEANQIPEEYKDMKVDILCNDCCQKSLQIPINFNYLKCTHCSSFNTQLM